MAKVHPNAAVVVAPQEHEHEHEHGTTGPARAPEQEPPPPTVLTVWRKSLLFNCDGFTVYDASGDLAFRVDCYAGSRLRRHRPADVVLMDATGKPLLTVRRKTRLGVADRCWDIYDGDAEDDGSTTSVATPLLTVRRHTVGLGANCKTLARVVAHPVADAAADASYVVEGSYGQRACVVRDASSSACGGGAGVVAEVQRKEAVGDDVFRLVVPGPHLGAPLAMALVIALDDMFRGGSGSGAGGWSARSLLRRTLSLSA